MARHLLLGNGGAVGISSGVVTDKAIFLQAEDGTILDNAETHALSNSFRVIQGTAGANIVSPWINAKNIISVTTAVAASQAAQVGTLTFATNASSAFNVELKLIDKSFGVAPATLRSFEAAIVAGNTPTIIAAAVAAAVNANLPSFIKSCSSAAGVVTLTGYKKGEAMANGSIAEEVVIFGAADNSADFKGTGLTVSIAATAASKGSGDEFYLREAEVNAQGVGSGYYDRIKFPNAPATYAAASHKYTMITIVATKDGSTSSAINGVDNLIEVNICMRKIASDALLDALVVKLTSYLGSVGFPALTGLDS